MYDSLLQLSPQMIRKQKEILRDQARIKRMALLPAKKNYTPKTQLNPEVRKEEIEARKKHLRQRIDYCLCRDVGYSQEDFARRRKVYLEMNNPHVTEAELKRLFLEVKGGRK